VKLFCYPDGPATQFLSCINIGASVRHALAQITLMAQSGFFVFVLMQLKSFVFNIYHIVMTSIAWHCENESNKSA
jgi:uncharacterized Tic20 family protein